ncbi:MAG: hypothetical protein HYU69_07030 [Bacteroidetes bacterium]|nr:hypothetical protein [Bacteroidota bacterium]
MDTKKLLLQYVTYNHWANDRLSGVMLKIDPALLDKEVKSSFPSLRKTVHHIWDAELAWMSRLKEEAVNWPPSAQFKEPTINQFLIASKDFIEFGASKENSYFSGSTSYKNIKGNTFSTTNHGIIMHCMNHSTFHRGQLITILRELGVSELPSTDLIAFLRELK